ncbi:serine hydrolase-domain-containing protein [Baffinella frigidus]|nr:serine hydrolase-domain-containing protein [Cryptophyta sp. CCMP2293]
MSLATALSLSFTSSARLLAVGRVPRRAFAAGALMATQAFCSGGDSPRGAPSVRKLRVLALHGFAQDVEAFKAKTGSLRGSVKDLVEFEYALAPLVDFHEQIGEGRTWYLFSQQEKGDMKWGKFDETLAYLATVFKEKGPFDGVLGFSQGACLAATLACMQGKDAAPEGVEFKFVAAVSGFVPRDPVLMTYFHKNSCALPSFHCIGEADQITPPARNEALRDCFLDPVTFRHTRGHMVPSDKAVHQGFRDFILRQMASAVASPALEASVASAALELEKAAL